MLCVSYCAGEHLQLTCQLVAVPSAQIIWYKDSRAIDANLSGVSITLVCL
jgi:hypothetical protein